VRRGTTFFLVVGLILIAGGFLTIQLLSSGPDGALPVRIQTDNPEASTAAVTGNQAIGFILFSLFAFGSLVGGGIVLALIFRALDREITHNKQ
jgi:hypothetical protein